LRKNGLLEKLPLATEIEITSTLKIETSLQLAESAFTDLALRNEWLPEVNLILKLNPGKNLRFAWQNAQVVVVTFKQKGPSKCQNSLHHSKLPDRISSAEMKCFWKEKLAKVSRLLKSK
jgi:hypothetical protein